MGKHNVLVAGNFICAKNPFDGQATKTLNVVNEITKKYQHLNVSFFDYSKYKKRWSLPLLMFKFNKALKNIDSVFIFPGGKNALSFLSFLLYSFKKKHNIHIFYPVVGGWLFDAVNNKKTILKYLSCFDGIYVETHKMNQKLVELGLTNVFYSPVFSLRTSLKKDQISSVCSSLEKDKRLYLCTFSRVCFEKGIGLAIEAASKVSNRTKMKIVLEIYGAIDKKQEKELMIMFSKLKSDFLEINYFGIIPDDDVIDVISHHHALLFPTFYSGEGFPATLLEAYKAGLPVIASRWAYNEEIIKENMTGFLFSLNTEELEKRIEWCLFNQDILLSMKTNCVVEAKKYEPSIALKPLFDDFEKALGKKQK